MSPKIKWRVIAPVRSTTSAIGLCYSCAVCRLGSINIVLAICNLNRCFGVGVVHHRAVQRFIWIHQSLYVPVGVLSKFLGSEAQGYPTEEEVFVSNRIPIVLDLLERDDEHSAIPRSSSSSIILKIAPQGVCWDVPPSSLHLLDWMRLEFLYPLEQVFGASRRSLTFTLFRHELFNFFTLSSLREGSFSW